MAGRPEWGYNCDMKSKFIVTTLACASIAFYLSRIIWPDMAGVTPPSAALMPLFLILSVLEALAFGAGVSFLLYGWPLLKAAFPQYKAIDRFAFLAIVWSLISWWPHDNMHRVTTDGDYSRLLGIEYGFHATLMVSGIVIAAFMWKVIRSARQTM